MTEQVRSENFDPRRRRRNRALLVGLLVLSMLPLIAAVWLYYGAPGMVAGAQTNRGALLDPPGQVEALGLVRSDGEVLTAADTRLWRVIVFPPRPCDEACLEQLFLLRQVDVLLGRDEDRVERYVVFPPGTSGALRADLEQRLPRMEQLSAAAGTLRDFLSERSARGGEVEPRPGSRTTGVLTVDPLGNVIFLHDLEQIGEPLLEDLDRLLRLSNIG